MGEEIEDGLVGITSLRSTALRLFMEGNDRSHNNSEYNTPYNLNQERSVVGVGDGRRKGEVLLFSSSFCRLNMSLYL